jgi:hypothetical protein
MSKITGRCLCGQTTYIAHGQSDGLRVCHCSDCRRWNGGPAPAVSFAGGVEILTPDRVRWHRSSEWAERGSCRTCGAAVFYRLVDGDFINVSAGSLDDQDAIGPVIEHIFADSKPSWYDFADDAPRITGAEFVARFQSSPQDQP